MNNELNNIKIERQKKGWTQEELAEQIFVSRQTISNWENGRSLPSYENLILLSKVFNISIDYFYSNNLEEKQTKVANSREETRNPELWNVGLIILVVISIFIPYAAPISLCVLFVWKEKLMPKLFKGALAFMIFFTVIEVLVTVLVFIHFII